MCGCSLRTRSDGTGAAQAVHATELERAASHGNMLVIGCCRSRGVVVGHCGYFLLSTLHILSHPKAEVGAAVAARRTPARNPASGLPPLPPRRTGSPPPAGRDGSRPAPAATASGRNRRSVPPRRA